MTCETCNSETSVLDSRTSSLNQVKRRRICQNCGRKFSTTELRSTRLTALEKAETFRNTVKEYLRDLFTELQIPIGETNAAEK